MPRLATYREVLNMKGIGEILNKLHNVKKLKDDEFTACCPAHISQQKNHQNLTVTQKDDNILIHCFAGCTPESIVSTLGFEMADLFIKPDTVPIKQEPPRIVATYDYQDEKGNPVYQVVRYLPKEFKQRHRNGNGEWNWSMEGVQRYLYHLPEVIQSPKVYLVEGEKDADNLINYALIATTSPGGANNWKPEYGTYLKGKKVIVIPDKDSAGYAYAKDIIHSIEDKAADIKVIILPGAGIKDVSDWLQTQDDMSQIEDRLTTFEQDISVLLDTDKPIYQIKEDSVTWRKPLDTLSLTFSAERVSQERTGTHARITIKYDYNLLDWSYFNIERSEDRTRLAYSAHKQMKGDVTDKYKKDDMRRDLDYFCGGLWDFYVSSFVPELMDGDETEQPLNFLLYPYILENGGTIVYAPPGRGKSYTALLWAISCNSGCTKFWRVIQTPTLFINLERSRESLRRRVATVNRVLGLPGNTPLHTLNARGKSLSDVVPASKKYIQKFGIKMIVLDSISRAGYGDLNENQPMNKIIDALSSLCPTWMALSHTSRANEDHAFGSIMLDAGADICIQLASQIAEDGTLGMGWEITKQNDVGKKPQQIYALEFNDFGLANMRLAKPYEFPEVEGKRKQDTMTALIEFVSNRESGDATATEVADGTGVDRGNVSRLLNNSGRFVETRKVGRSVYYGVKTNVNKNLNISSEW
jgi:hypothetical protein